jgi:hypothetical protein
MQTLGTRKPTTGAKYSGSANPFARALSEVEKTSGGLNPNRLNNLPDTVSNGLMQGQGLSPDLTNQNQAELLKQQQAEALKKKRRQELHDRVNPVKETDVFSARRRQVKEEIERLRAELKALAQDIAKFHKEVEVTLMTSVGDPGRDGAYYLNFFHKLRAFIKLLRQQIKSANTWATQVNSKKKKKKRGKKPGLEVGGTKSEKTSTVFDMMHHERSNAYGGS